MSLRTRAKSPSLPCLTQIAIFKGLYDSHIDLIELAVRDLNSRAEASGKVDEFIKEIKRKVGGISSSYTDIAAARNTMAEWYVIQIHTVAESIFDQIRRELSTYRPALIWDTDNSLNSLNRLIDGIKAPHLTELIEYDIIEYYGAVRNYLTHGGKVGRLVKLRQGILDKWAADIGRRYRPNSLNLPGELTYSDYKDFTKALTYILTHINDACALTPSEIAKWMMQDPTQRRYLLRERGKAGFKNYLKKTIKILYWTSDSLTAEVLHAVMVLLDDVPNKHVRRRWVKQVAT